MQLIQKYGHLKKSILEPLGLTRLIRQPGTYI